MSIPLSIAQKVAARALEAAETHEVKIVAVVVDLGGHPVVAMRMDGASYVNTDMAKRKGNLAAAFSTSTAQIHTMIGKDPVAAPVLQADSGIALLPGGAPILVDGKCVGGLGIAGGHYLQDQAVADFAVGE